MRFQIFKVFPRTSYLITIGSKDKPDSQFREKIKSDINKAMISFDCEDGASHSIAIVTDWNLAEGERTDLPEISPGGQYLIFALFSSGENSADSREKEEAIRENQAEIETALRILIGEENVNDINIGLVLLRDCSVTVLPVFSPQGKEYQKGWIKKHPHSDYWMKS